MVGKYAFMAPGVSGDTDDFNQALEWLRNERARFPESGKEGAIYIRLDLAAKLSTDDLRILLSLAMETNKGKVA
jgi:hypothetical protein